MKTSRKIGKPKIEVSAYRNAPRGEKWWEWKIDGGEHGWGLVQGTKAEARRAAERRLRDAEVVA